MQLGLRYFDVVMHGDKVSDGRVHVLKSWTLRITSQDYGIYPVHYTDHSIHHRQTRNMASGADNEVTRDTLEIDPVWTTSRTARQIYALGEVEKVRRKQHMLFPPA